MMATGLNEKGEKKGKKQPIGSVGIKPQDMTL